MLMSKFWRAASVAALLAATVVSTTVAAGSWSATGKMNKVRYFHTLTALDGGKAVAIGGFDENNPIASAESFDGGVWTAVGDMATPRMRHTATKLPDGRVLIVGGRNTTAAIATAELFDPASGGFAAAGQLATPRYDHTAVATPDGRVFVFGGNTDQSAVGSDETENPVFAAPAVDSIEMWSAATGAFEPVGAMAMDRSGHQSLLLPDGRILSVGGIGRTPDTGPDGSQAATRWSAELFDPGASASALTGSMAAPRAEFSAVLVGASVVVAGGHTDQLDVHASAEQYDPAAGAWAPAGTLTQPRMRAVAVAMPDGSVALIGGLGPNETLPTSETMGAGNVWTASAKMAEPRDRAAGVLLSDGRILVAGGFNTGGFLGFGGGLNTAELWSP